MTTFSVKLVSLTTPTVPGINSAEEFIAYVARVSSPANQLNTQTAPKLIKYLLEHKHFSPFEQVNMGVEITTSRGIAPQILRHRTAVFQEFCIAGDTDVWFDLPAGVRKKKRRLYKIKISELHRKWNKSPFAQKSIAKMHVRCFNQDTGLLEHSTIKNVFFTGEKDLFRITLANGKTITCTKEHKFLSREGFCSLEDLVGLKVTASGMASMSKVAEVGCNGQPLYLDREWLQAAKARSIFDKTGLLGIAKEAGCSYHTIRKWLKLHGLSFSKHEVASIYSVWNKGVFGYRLPPHTEQTKQKMRDSARRGADSNLWRGGVARSFRMRVADYCTTIRREILERDGWKCFVCGVGGKLEIHHKKPVYSHPELAFAKDNLGAICRQCHRQEHKQHAKDWLPPRPEMDLGPRWTKVAKIEFVGRGPTYDLEINCPSHNYVANGIIVHNSQRYSEVTDYVVYPARRQDTKNRQNSIDDLDDNTKAWFELAQHEVASLAMLRYQEALEKGIAKEQARFLLTLGTQTKLYMTNNIRNWIFYLDLRRGNGTQLEHKEIADAIIKDIFVPNFPVISSALGWTNEG